MIQEYDLYSNEDHGTWSLLFSRQLENLRDKASSQYLDAIDNLQDAHNEKAIPSFRDLDAKLWAATGWTIEVVPGLIPVEDFFELLSRRRFCSSTWIRERSQLDYLEEPDMFHDIFGHIPLLMNPVYADFMQKFGALGVKLKDNPQAVIQLERLYWYTIEFGLIKEEGKNKIYGAGICSSYGESKQIYQDVNLKVFPFEIEKVLHQKFTKSVMQTEYFAIESFEQLWKSLDKAEAILSDLAVV